MSVTMRLEAVTVSCTLQMPGPVSMHAPKPQYGLSWLLCVKYELTIRACSGHADFFELVKGIGEAKSKQEEDKVRHNECVRR